MKPYKDNSRLMSRAEAAAYCASSPATFSRWVSAGLLPQSLPGIQRWDRSAIDRRLDILSGIADSSEADDDPYSIWKGKDLAR